MKTFAVKEKRSAPAIRRSQPSRFGYRGPEVKAQQAEICRILRYTGAQAKLTIGQPNDKNEQEADSVAEQVMAMPDPKLQRQPEEEEEEETLQAKPLADQITPLVQRQEDPPEEEEEPVQAKTTSGSAPEVTPEIGSGIRSLRGGGRQLFRSERCFFEQRFGVGFGDVCVHNDTRAARVARSVNARAFTLGRDVVFGTGEYTSGVRSGRRLLAHELSHVVQQSKIRQIPQRFSLVQRAPQVGATQPLKLFAVREPMAREYEGGLAATVFFGRGLFFLDRSNAEAVEGIGLLLSFLPGARVLVHGHASTESGSAFNQKLSENRMETVIALLSAYSLGALSISKKASGEDMPLVNETGSGDELEQQRQWNRRVEIIVIKLPPPPIKHYPEVLGPKEKGGLDKDISSESQPEPPSTYKQLEDRFNKLRNNPFVKHFVAPSLEESFEQGRPTLKFRWEF